MASNDRPVPQVTEKKPWNGVYYGKLAHLNKKVYNKTNTKVNPHQVAAYSARKNYGHVLNEVSPAADMLIDQTLNPEDAIDIERWPNTYGLSAVYKCKTILNARFDPTGRSCVAVSPNIKDSIFATTGDQSIVPIGPYASATTAAPYSFQNVTLDGQTVYWNAPIICSNGQALLPFPYAPEGELLYPIGFDTASRTGVNITLRMRLPNAIARQGYYVVTFYDATFTKITPLRQGAFASITATSTTPGGIGADILIGVAPNVDIIHYMSIILFQNSTGPDSRLPYKGPVYMWINADDANTTGLNLVMPNHSQHVNIYDIKDASQIATSASRAFVLAQSLLVTAEMSDINNGGMMAIARVPAGTAIGTDSVNYSGGLTSNNWYEWLSSLANNNYDGPVKDGGYSFYLPEDETGFFYRPVDNYFSAQLPYLASEFTVTAGLQETAIVRIKVSTIVQFTTNASIYDQRPSCYLLEDELVHHILSLVPASYSNDGHKAALKKVLKNVGTTLGKALRNPETYKNMAKVLTMIAPLLV